MTARCEAQKYHDWCQLDRMEREPNPPTSVPPNIQDCWDLANLLDDFPLALVQASGAIWFFPFSIGDYCEKYKREYDRLQKEEDNLTERDKDPCQMNCEYYEPHSPKISMDGVAKLAEGAIMRRERCQN